MKAVVLLLAISNVLLGVCLVWHIVGHIRQLGPSHNGQDA